MRLRALMTVALPGMNPVAAFPIMMASCEFLLPLGGLRFLEHDRFHPHAALGGVPGVLIAACLGKSLPLTSARWLVMATVLFTAASMLRSALKADREESGNP